MKPIAADGSMHEPWVKITAIYTWYMVVHHCIDMLLAAIQLVQHPRSAGLHQKCTQSRSLLSASNM